MPLIHGREPQPRERPNGIQYSPIKMIINNNLLHKSIPSQEMIIFYIYSNFAGQHLPDVCINLQQTQFSIAKSRHIHIKYFPRNFQILNYKRRKYFSPDCKCRTKFYISSTIRVSLPLLTILVTLQFIHTSFTLLPFGKL